MAKNLASCSTSSRGLGAHDSRGVCRFGDPSVRFASVKEVGGGHGILNQTLTELHVEVMGLAWEDLKDYDLLWSLNNYLGGPFSNALTRTWRSC